MKGAGIREAENHWSTLCPQSWPNTLGLARQLSSSQKKLSGGHRREDGARRWQHPGQAGLDWPFLTEALGLLLAPEYGKGGKSTGWTRGRQQAV